MCTGVRMQSTQGVSLQLRIGTAAHVCGTLTARTRFATSHASSNTGRSIATASGWLGLRTSKKRSHTIFTQNYPHAHSLILSLSLNLPLTHFSCVFYNYNRPNACIVATGSDDKSVRLWDIRQKRAALYCVGCLARHHGSVDALAFSRDGMFVASGGADRQILVWDLRSIANPIHVFRGHTDVSCSLTREQNGRTCVCVVTLALLSRRDSFEMALPPSVASSRLSPPPLFSGRVSHLHAFSRLSPLASRLLSPPRRRFGRSTLRSAARAARSSLRAARTAQCGCGM